MKNFTSIKACVLASYLLSSLAPAYACTTGEVAPTPSTIAQATTVFKSMTDRLSYGAKISGAALFAASLYVFFSCEPNRNPVRYDLEKLKAGEFDLENIKYLILDGLIGHKGKRPSLRVDPETGKVDASVGTYQKGIYGNLYEMIQPALKTLGFIATCKKFSSDWDKGITDWSAFLEIN